MLPNIEIVPITSTYWCSVTTKERFITSSSKTCQPSSPAAITINMKHLSPLTASAVFHNSDYSSRIYRNVRSIPSRRLFILHPINRKRMSKSVTKILPVLFILLADFEAFMVPMEENKRNCLNTKVHNCTNRVGLRASGSCKFRNLMVRSSHIVVMTSWIKIFIRNL